MEIISNKLLFRASGVGALCTKNQKVGLTEKQIITFDGFIAKTKEGKDLTPTQAKEYERLKALKDAPPELSDTAKTFMRELWLWHKKGIYTEIKSKYLEKGIYAETEAIKLLVDVEKKYYKKNLIRKDNGVLTGLPDIIYKKLVIDTKCCWNANTFMASKLTDLYEWQGRVYMELFDCDEFELKYCLVDCPPHIYEFELYKFKMAKNIIDDTIPEAKAMIANFRKTLIYSDNPNFTKEERVKTFKIYRDDTKIEYLYDQISMATKFYENLTLNQVA